MDYLAEHRIILGKAANDDLPEQINEGSSIPIGAVRELVEEGLLRAIDASSFDGRAYMEPRITVAGREYLNELNRRTMEASPAGKAKRIGLRILDWSGGIIAGVLIAWASTKVL
ncbi:MAG: hypothetical protein ACREVE_12640 [Gammaproteobacteria bacterium]